MPYCEKCKRTYPLGTVYCPECGSRLIVGELKFKQVTGEPYSFCPQCGRMVNQNDAYCQYCGKLLAQQPQPTQPYRPTIPAPSPMAKSTVKRGIKKRTILLAFLVFIFVLGVVYTVIPKDEVLLSKTLTLTDLRDVDEYTFDLNKGDKIQIEFTVTGGPIEFYIDNSTTTVFDKIQVLSGNYIYNVPKTGRYLFGFWLMDSRSTVNIRIVRKAQ